jgi:hypothetical protein
MAMLVCPFKLIAELGAWKRMSLVASGVICVQSEARMRHPTCVKQARTAESVNGTLPARFLRQTMDKA